MMVILSATANTNPNTENRTYQHQHQHQLRILCEPMVAGWDGDVQQANSEAFRRRHCSCTATHHGWSWQCVRGMIHRILLQHELVCICLPTIPHTRSTHRFCVTNTKLDFSPGQHTAGRSSAPRSNRPRAKLHLCQRALLRCGHCNGLYKTCTNESSVVVAVCGVPQSQIPSDCRQLLATRVPLLAYLAVRLAVRASHGHDGGVAAGSTIRPSLPFRASLNRSWSWSGPGPDLIVVGQLAATGQLLMRCQPLHVLVQCRGIRCSPPVYDCTGHVWTEAWSTDLQVCVHDASDA